MSFPDSPFSTGAPYIVSTGLLSRRGSLASLASSTHLDKEQMAKELDKIHNAASNSDSLTTFNEFAPPPPSTSSMEAKGLAGDLMQNGLSGLYSRFRGAVGGGKERPGSSLKGENDGTENASVKSQDGTTPSRRSISHARENSGIMSPAQASDSSSRLQSPTSLTFMVADNQSHATKSSRPSLSSALPAPKSASSSRPSIVKTIPSSSTVPTVAPVTVNASAAGTFGFGEHREHRRVVSSTTGADESDASDYGFVQSGVIDRSTQGSLENGRSTLESSMGGTDGSVDGYPVHSRPPGSSKSASSALSSVQASDALRPTALSRLTVPQAMRKAPTRVTASHLPGYQASRTSSTDRSTAELSPITTSAHNVVHHESFASASEERRDSLKGSTGRFRIPGTVSTQGGTGVVSARLEQMRKQVLSKEFWMADEICKECFLCNDTFSAFRRKHHCRTCGCIFDSKCTSSISGQRFGVQGSLRICKTCLDVINRRHDSSGSDDSDDDATLPNFFQSQQAKLELSNANQSNIAGNPNGNVDRNRPLSTPMMAIPATRRITDSSNRRSAILEIDAPQLARPSSARSIKTLSNSIRPPSSGHRRHTSKHNFLGRFKAGAEERAPFHRASEDIGKKTRLPAFHDDNIIDPDLAPYMSDDGSSGDEQMSIFATLNSGSLTPSHENDRSGFGTLLSASKKHRTRGGEKSVSGISFTSRGLEDIGGSAPISGFSRPNRRRNMSAASDHLYHARSNPRQNKPTNLSWGVANLADDAAQKGDASDPVKSGPGPFKMMRSASMRDAKAPAIELNAASLHHVRRLLHQLLQDAQIPNVTSWEKALIPILLQCTDDVNPDVRRGDDIDIRHYVKLKRIPGGKPGDTSYVSGVVFTKNLALKSMPRSISNPRIVIVSFPIEYSRHQSHYMSLEPVIAQEKDFLKNMVNRIASLRPQLLLVEKNISGLALQYLSEANISVISNVKNSVITAVSRCAQTEVISSIDMVALKPVHTGRSEGFDVKTYVHKDIPDTKKTCVYISGCPKELGCTIVLRGAGMAVLAKMKQITEFMIYVVYNLKLETCLMRDEFVLIPSIADSSENLSPKRRTGSRAVAGSEESARNTVLAASEKLQAVADARDALLTETTNQAENTAVQSSGVLDAVATSTELPMDGQITLEQNLQPPRISAHESHVLASHDEQVPEDDIIPTFYSDMVAEHQTKILSASPFVRFEQPYLLVRAREQERRLNSLKRLRDRDSYVSTESEKSKPQKFQLLTPEMVHATVDTAPRQILEVLHAVHDAEYDKALHNYQTQKRQWENSIQGNLNLFDPYEHQNITVLYTVVCTETSIPCAGPDFVTLSFYNEQEVDPSIGPDCTLGWYVEDLCEIVNSNTRCTFSGCDRKMSEHHRTYVHGEARLTIFAEKSPCKIKGLHDSILMWSYCKKCEKETQVMPMSESTWKYSLGKYLELSFWSSELRLRAGICPHDIHRDHLRYFGYRNVAIRIHYDPIDLLEIIVPRARVTWKVEKDLQLKNDLFTKIEERWNRFMASVHSRIEGINTESVAPEKTEACQAEIERLTRRAQDEHALLIRKLQQKYMESKFYEILPLNRAVRAMQEKVTEWDDAFANFDRNFFPSERDIRRLAAIQLKRMFMDREESSTTMSSAEATELTSDIDEKMPEQALDTIPAPPDHIMQVEGALGSVLEEDSMDDPESPTTPTLPQNIPLPQGDADDTNPSELDREGVAHLDLAFPPDSNSDSLTEVPTSTIVSGSESPFDNESEQLDKFVGAPLDASLSEKIEQLRKLSSAEQGQTNLDISSIPRPIDRLPVPARRLGMATSPPIHRTQSQPAGALRRVNIGASKAFTKQPLHLSDVGPLELKLSATESVRPADKRLSERLGLATMKQRKSGHSLIPRSVQGKRRESKVVSTLAKHFEQLSREFEKERLRDRKQRAAKATQSRAFPKASSKPIVEIYKDVNEAVEERGPVQDMTANPLPHNTGTSSMVGGLTDSQDFMCAEPQSPTSTAATADETATEAETDDTHQNFSQTGSDDEGNNSDADHSLLDEMIPGAAEIADSIRAGKPNSDIGMELPKHEKTSLMKMLTNFWAERSASGWTQLDYPINVGEHIFADQDVIVREDEPSSLIAFTLNSDTYKANINRLRMQGPSRPKTANSTTGVPATPDDCDDGVDQAEVERSLLRATGTHLSFSFTESTARMQCKIFFAEQFDAVRRKCGVSDRIVESLSRCLKWDSKGGKTKAVFLKTLDDRLVLKALSAIETQAFLKFAPAYFNIISEALFHELPTVIAKMLGFFQIVIKNPVTGMEIKWDVLVMENLFYDRSPTRIFDLKGSMRNRKIQSTGEQNEVLLDENMVEFIYESPLFAREHSKKLLRSAIFNDTLFLQRNDVMDYSLMVAVDDEKKELVVGIIDVVRTYTWDKKLESWIKDRGFAGGGRNRPTVTSPKEYKSRFREAMNRYILQAPNSWHNPMGVGRQQEQRMLMDAQK